MSLLGPAGSDQYTGLDQFGRVVSLQWINASGTTVDGCNCANVAVAFRGTGAQI